MGTRMNEDERKKRLDESHERAVRQAMFSASDDLIRRHNEKPSEENKTIEARLENIEQRLNQLESTGK